MRVPVPRWPLVMPAALLVLAVGAAGPAPAWLPAGSGFLGPLGAAEARAQEAMKFEVVPAESVEALERRHRGSSTPPARSRRPDRPPSGAAPAPPESPESPEPVEGPITRSGDVVRFGSDIRIERNRVVEGDVFALRGDIQVYGHVRGNVVSTGGDVRLGATARVDGDVVCIGGELTEEPGAVVGGQRVTALYGRGSGRRVDRLVRERVQDRFRDRDRWDDGLRHAGDLGASLSWLLVALLVAWAIPRFAPARTGTALATMRRETGTSSLIGIATVLLLPPSLVALAILVAILCITFIGIPLALGLLLGYAALLVVLATWGYVVGVIPAGEYVGARLGKSPASLATAAVYGTLAIVGLTVASAVLRFLPFFGWLAGVLWIVALVAGVAVTMAGAGALLRSKFGQGPGGRWWPPFAAPRGPAPASPGASVSPGAAPSPPPTRGTELPGAPEPPS